MIKGDDYDGYNDDGADDDIHLLYVLPSESTYLKSLDKQIICQQFLDQRAAHDDIIT